MVGIPSNSNIDDKGIQYWEKQAKDVNNVDETFDNARDLGYVRLNYSRLTAIGKLSSQYDSSDMYKITVQSKGSLGLSIRTTGDGDKVLDLSKYDEAYKQLLAQTDPEAYQALIDKENEESSKKQLLEYTAPGMKVEIYQSKNGRNVLIGDSAAEPGSDLRVALEDMLKGEKQVVAGTYYAKISRDDSIGANDELDYIFQTSMGKGFKHEYAFTEAPSTDTKANKESKISVAMQNQLGGASAMQAQAERNQLLSQMMTISYQGISSLYSKNSQWWKNS